MRNLLILAVVIAAAAVATKPKQEDFEKRIETGTENLIKQGIKEGDIVKSVTGAGMLMLAEKKYEDHIVVSSFEMRFDKDHAVVCLGYFAQISCR